MSGTWGSGIAVARPSGSDAHATARAAWSGRMRTLVGVLEKRPDPRSLSAYGSGTGPLGDSRTPDSDPPSQLPHLHPAAAPAHVDGRPPCGGTEFDAFFQRYEQPLYGYLRRMLPSDEVAVELAQETFFRAWRHFEELSGYERPEAWLYRVATNLAISHLRRKRAFSFSQVFKRGSEGDATELVGEHELLADGLDVERQTVERDLIARVLQRLPERQRAALLLRAVYGHSCAEVAWALGISLPNARQTLSRGRERFRRLYESEQGDSVS